MAISYRIPQNLDYLQNKPKRINWKVIAPLEAKLSPLQEYDIVFDSIDLKIRKL